MFLRKRRAVFSTEDVFLIDVDHVVLRFMLSADGDGDGGGAGGAGAGDGGAGDGGTGKGDGDGGAGDGGGSGDGGDGDGAGSKSPEWLAALSSDATKKFADGSPDLEHLVGRAVKMREQLAGAVVPPGKDADDAEVASYRKKIGVPDKPEGYVIAMPKGSEATEVDKAFHSSLAAKFHDLNVPASVATELNNLVNDHTLALQQMIVDEDKRFADESETELRRLWPGDQYDANSERANRAMQTVFEGEDFEDFRRMEDKAGNLIADNPMMLRAFAILERRFEEGGLQRALSDGERVEAKDKITDLRAKQADATERGDSKEANRLYQEEQALLAKTNGNRGVVGSQGRAA